MYICMCNALREKDFKNACAGCPNACDAEAIFDVLGCKPACGSCLPYVNELLVPDSEYATI